MAVCYVGWLFIPKSHNQLDYKMLEFTIPKIIPCEGSHNIK